MKQSVLFLIFTCLIFFSCSNNHTLKISYAETETLRDVLKEKESDIKWAADIDGDRLHKSTKVDNHIISNSVSVDNQTVKILKQFQQPVYVQLEDFGILDTSILTDVQKSTLKDFVSSIATDFYKKPYDFFAIDYKFNYSFFKNDFISGWKNQFTDNFPESSNTEDSQIKLFSKWYFGECLKFENEIIIPVRASCNGKFIDFTIYASNDASIQIYNVQINKWSE